MSISGVSSALHLAAAERAAIRGGLKQSTPATGKTKVAKPPKQGRTPEMEREHFKYIYTTPENGGRFGKIEDALLTFDAAHPRLSTALAVGSVVGVATLAGSIVGLGVDELAHLTERKNDSVGRAVGTLVGVIIALTHMSALFAINRRMQLWLKTGELRQDALNFGQSREFMAKQCPVLMQMAERNNKANQGVTSAALRVVPEDIRKALNDITKESLKPEQWNASLIGYKHRPAGKTVYYQAQVSVPKCGIQKGYFYVSKWQSFRELLQDDWNKTFSRTSRAHDDIAGKLVWEYAKIADKNNIPQKDNLFELPPVADCFGQFRKFRVNAESKAELDRLTKRFTEPFLTKKREAERKAVDADVDFAGVDFAKLVDYVKTDCPHLQANVLSHFRKEFDDEENFVGHKENVRTCVRIDEITKMPNMYSGLRPATMMTFWRNMSDSLTFGMRRFHDPTAQAGNAGLSAGMYLPMMCIGSVATVLGLGISSTSGPPITGAVAESAKAGEKKGDQAKEVSFGTMPVLFPGDMQSESARNQVEKKMLDATPSLTNIRVQPAQPPPSNPYAAFAQAKAYQTGHNPYQTPQHQTAQEQAAKQQAQYASQYQAQSVAQNGAQYPAQSSFQGYNGYYSQGPGQAASAA